MNPEADKFFKNTENWKEELQALRKLALECGFSEEWKWKQPCYTFQNKNVFIISPFKNYCSINFFQGSLLKDAQKLLVKPGENTQEGRQMRFTNWEEIELKEKWITKYMMEAKEVIIKDIQPASAETPTITIPRELEEKFKENAELKIAFYKLTPGRQRAYLIYFTGAKQSKTIQDRIEKYIPRILNGKGFHDCICGLSKKMPNCDGSHKLLEKQKNP